MSKPRFFAYKYPKEGIAAEYRAATQKICDEHQVVWVHRFRQRDVKEWLSPLFRGESAYADGHCHVIAVMYLHLRDLAQGKPDLGRRLLKYWCFKNEGKLQQKIPDIEDQLSAHGQFGQKYFQDAGLKDLMHIAEEYWGNIESRRKSARAVGEYEDAEIFFPDSDRVNTFTRRFQEKDYEGTHDLDFVHQCNPGYLLAKNHVYRNIDNYDQIAEAITQEVTEQNEKELRIIINLKNQQEAAHTISIACFPDDQNNFELVDANRGVMLIPVGNKNTLCNFLSCYLKQMYQDFEFNQVQIEKYLHKYETILSRSEKDQLERIQNRRDKLESITARTHKK